MQLIAKFRRWIHSMTIYRSEVTMTPEEKAANDRINKGLKKVRGEK